MKNVIRIAAALMAASLSLFGCETSPESSQNSLADSKVEAISEEVSFPPETTTTNNSTSTKYDTTTTATTTTTVIPTTPTTRAVPVTTTTEIKAVAPPISLSDIPSYSGSPYVEVNGNTPFFDDFPTDVFEIYSPLDFLGRCGVAYANICKDIMPTEPRGEIGMIKPSGWQTIKYNGLIDGNYLYNRCHLIGYQLAGENANERNLITGTRYMNTVGMEPFENKIANYVESYNVHVLYRVTPIFDGNNLVASGVLMEAYSLEDDGSGIKFCVFCYNVQPGIGINYANGESWLLEEPASEAPAEVPDRSVSNDQTYILNTNTKKFHYPTCSSVKQMKDKNKQEYSGTREEVISMGYDPCQNCNP